MPTVIPRRKVAPAPVVAVIVINWNGSRWLDVCLDSVRRSTYPNLSITVVDNASTDGSMAQVNSQFTRIKCVYNRRNTGFAGGANTGLRQAWKSGADYALILNQDTRVAPGWLEPMVQAAESNSDIGVLSPMQLVYDGATPDPLFAKYNFARATPFVNAGGETLLEADWVVGAALMLRRSACNLVGHFDPLYFCYYEEMDLCRRMRYHGYRVCIVPGSSIHHYNGQVHASRRSFHLVRNRALYFLKDPQQSWWYKLRHYTRWWRQKPSGWPMDLNHRLRLAYIHFWVLCCLPRNIFRLWRERSGFGRDEQLS